MASNRATLPYKFLVRGLFYVFIGLIAARIVLPLAFSSAGTAMADMIRDLWGCATTILAALLGMLAGKATSSA